MVAVGLIAGFTAIGAYVGYQFGAEHDSPILGTVVGALAGFGIGVVAVGGSVALLTVEGGAFIESLWVAKSTTELAAGLNLINPAGLAIVGGGIGSFLTGVGIGSVLLFELLFPTAEATAEITGRAQR